MEVDFRLENLPQIPLQPPELFMAAAQLDEESQDSFSQKPLMQSLGGCHSVFRLVGGSPVSPQLRKGRGCPHLPSETSTQLDWFRSHVCISFL